MSGSLSSGPSARLSAALRSLAHELPGLSPALLVVGLLLCLLLPLPSWLVDLLLSLSLASAVLLLVAALRVRRVVEFVVFPTLVMLATLARLALNVSTTRLILSEGNAGQVIEAFAGLVVRGDLIVGAVMFLVITAIQYLVVARGAERVAEVAARFELDGIPGRQAAIEADLRAKIISPAEAQARRAALSERSELFARMDGVMRWVKGDALVGLGITGINLFGGVAVGGLRAGLGPAQSLALYGKLAIGDGLLAQLPALLVSLAAAVLVARVDLATPQTRRRWLEPVMLLVPALLLGLLALVPGMPRLAFATSAVGLLALALWLSAQQLGTPTASAARPVLSVRAAFDSGPALTRDLERVRRRCAEALMIEIPPLRLEQPGPALGPREIELRLGARVLGRRELSRAGDEEDELLLACYQLIMDRAEELVTLEALEQRLEHARRLHPGLAREALRVVEVRDLLAIVRAFVREQIPAPRMDAVLGVLAEARVFQAEGEREAWPEHVREALVDYWLRDLCDGLESLGEARWLRPTPDFEDVLLGRAQQGSRGARVALSAPERARMLAQIRAPGDTRATALVCSARARPVFAGLVAGARPHIPVLSVGEFAAAGVEAPRCTRVDVEL